MGGGAAPASSLAGRARGRLRLRQWGVGACEGSGGGGEVRKGVLHSGGVMPARSRAAVRRKLAPASSECFYWLGGVREMQGEAAGQEDKVERTLAGALCGRHWRTACMGQRWCAGRLWASSGGWLGEIGGMGDPVCRA